MRLEYIGLSELSGSLIALEGVQGVAYDEMAEVTLENGERRYGRVILIDGDRVVLQVFEGTRGISLENASTHFTGKSMDIALSKEMLGRVFDGAGRPIDGLGEIYPEERRNINGSAINPVSRKYPRSYIHTGISSIDGCCHPHPGAEAAHLLRLRHEAQRAGRPDRAAGQGGRRGRGVRHCLCRHGRQERHRRVLPPLL